MAAASSCSILMCDGGRAVVVGDGGSWLPYIPQPPEGTTYVAAAIVGDELSVLLRDDGQAIGTRVDPYWGRSALQKWSKEVVPALPDEVRYTALSAGPSHVVLLRDDGHAIAVWKNYRRGNRRVQFEVQPPPPGSAYVKAAAAADRTVLLLDSGRAVVCNGAESDAAPEPAEGTSFVAVAAGYSHAVFLQDDGQAVIVGFDGAKVQPVPALPEGVRYVAVAAGETHTALLRDDGNVVAVNEFGRLHPPKPPSGVRYVALCAGSDHTLLLRDDGLAAAFGKNAAGQCQVPKPPPGAKYVAALAGTRHSVLIDDQGGAVACGQHGRIAAASGQRFVSPVLNVGSTVLMVSLMQAEEGSVDVTCYSLGGEETTMRVAGAECVWDLRVALARSLGKVTWSVKLVLSNGRLLSHADRSKIVADLVQECSSV